MPVNLILLDIVEFHVILERDRLLYHYSFGGSSTESSHFSMTCHPYSQPPWQTSETKTQINPHRKGETFIEKSCEGLLARVVDRDDNLVRLEIVNPVKLNFGRHS